MSVESAKAFLQKVKSDEALGKKLQDAADDDARKAIASEAGADFTKEEMKEVMKAASSKELSDDDLDAVAGGSSAGWVAAAAGIGGAAAAAA